VDDLHLPDVAAIRVPDSRAAIEAEQLCREESPPMLYAHALRSYFFAALLGRRDGLHFDEELLYVGCVLHDIGLTPAYEDPVRSFEFVSAGVAAGLAERHRWELARRYTLHRSVVLHMALSIMPTELPEVLLLEAGVACDVSGRRVGATWRPSPPPGRPAPLRGRTSTSPLARSPTRCASPTAEPTRRSDGVLPFSSGRAACRWSRAEPQWSANGSPASSRPGARPPPCDRCVTDQIYSASPSDYPIVL
jgi:hypothetical protein